MRRSKSSSNIPIPLFLNDPSRKRSTARASSEEKLNLLKYATPKHGYQVTSGFSSASSGRPPSTGSRRGPPSATCSRERKSIQALSGDKRWVDQQYDKVCMFIDESNLFTDKSFRNNVKPLTLKSFVYIMNILLGEIFSNIEITTDNYKEIIQQKFKVLRYPGTVSISTLKCVNVPHTFPQAIAMIGWLVDKVSLQLNVKHGRTEYLPMVIKSKTSQITFEYFLKRYVTYNEAPETDLREIDKEYIENIREVLNIDESMLREHEKNVKKSKEMIRDLENEIKTLKNLILETNMKTEKLQDEIKQFEKTQTNDITIQETEIEHMEHSIKATDVMFIKVQENIKALEEAIKQQPCSHQDKLVLLKKIGGLNERIRMEKEKIEHLDKIKQEFISKSDLEREKVKEAVKRWNHRLLKWTIYRPELKQFLLEEGRLDDDSFCDEVKQVQEKKEAVDKQLHCEKQKIDSLLSNQLKLKEELQIEVTSTEATLKELEDKIKSLEVVNDDLSMKLKKNDAEIKRTESNFRQEISELKQDCAELEENMKSISIELQKQSENLQVTMIKAVSYFASVYNQIRTTWSQVNKIRGDITNNILTKRDSMLNTILEVLREIEEVGQDLS